MNFRHFILPLLLLIALTGAPFGMGRMMDTMRDQHSSGMAMMHGMHHDNNKQTKHKQNAPHFMACAACAGLPAALVAQVAHEMHTGVLPGASLAFAGATQLPLLPPPRA